MNYIEWMNSMPRTNRQYIEDAAPGEWAKYDADFEQWCFEGRVFNASATPWLPTRMLVKDARNELDIAKSELADLQHEVERLRGNTKEDLCRLRKALRISAASNILLAVAFIIYVVNILLF